MAKSTRVLLCIAAMLMGAVSGVRGHFESSNMFFENEAAIQVDSKSCAVTGAHEVCHTAELALESGYTVHVCPNDGECGNGLCYYSPVPPCCPNANGLVCKSVSTLLIEGRRINVTLHRVTRLLPKEHETVCLSFSPAMNVCDKDCERRCPRVRECVQNIDCDSEGANCKCREGFTEESECCECAEGYYRNGTRCIKYCRENCRTRLPNSNGQPSGCGSCYRGFLPHDCCNCPPNLVKRDGVCKCEANLKTDGTCAEGTLEPDCCECDTTGNVTHAFYKTPSGECKPFCKSNCAVTGSSGCTTCNDGFITEPECCQRTDDCDKPQNLFFFIDATNSNTFENFCPLIIVLQMVVAAFSPSPSSGIQIGSLLFSDNAKHREPSPVFETDSSCLNAVQGDHSLRSLMEEFGICLDKHRKYDSTKFLSMCGEGTSAVWGLEKIRDIVRTKSARESTVLMITDGIIEDGTEERTTCLSELESAGVTIIEAGYGDADLSTMKLYTDPDNIMIDDDPVELGKAIVNKLKAKGILCDKYAKNVIESLEQAERNDAKLTLFCRCHRMENINHPRCLKKKYPVCGGDLSVGLNPTGMSETLDFQESDLEEEILAAVENVLERFNGH